MVRPLNTINQFLGTILALAVVGLIATAGYFGYRAYYADEWKYQDTQKELDEANAQIDQLKAESAVKDQEISRLDTAVRLLKVDHRIAWLEVTDRREVPAASPAEAPKVYTFFDFVELDHEGQPIPDSRLPLKIEGDVVYVDGLVVKYLDEYIEKGDPLRSTSAFLFRRVFGESQAPIDGELIDPEGKRPKAYQTGGKISAFEAEIWKNFWDIANDPEKAKRAGVRAAHGEAVSMKLVPNKRYRVELRASAGVSIVPDGDVPVPLTGTL